jgi:hypothetical protein
MSNHNQHDRPREVNGDGNAAIERQLAGYVPTPPRLNRDRLMFLAGQASAVSPTADGRERRVDAAAIRSNWLWPAATAALAATSLALAMALFNRPASQVQIVYVPQPAAEVKATDKSDNTDLTKQPRQIDSDLVVAQSQPTAHPARRRAPMPANNYLRSRDVALHLGLDALGSPRGHGGGGGEATTYQSWLQGLLSPSEAPEAAPASSPKL